MMKLLMKVCVSNYYTAFVIHFSRGGMDILPVVFPSLHLMGGGRRVGGGRKKKERNVPLSIFSFFVTTFIHN